MLLTEESLLASPTFLAFCQAWEADKRCPFGLIDWLWGDMDNEAMAMAAKWAYETYRDGHGLQSRAGYISPRLNPETNHYYFCAYKTKKLVYFSSDLNKHAINSPIMNDKRTVFWSTSFPAAIAWFLCNFDASKLPAETIST